MTVSKNHLIKFGVSGLAVLALAGCGKKDDDKGASPTPTNTTTPTTLDLYGSACSSTSDQYICNHSKVADYYAATGSNPFESNMDVYKFTPAPTASTWTVTDAAGNTVTSINLTQGKPTKFILVGSTSTAHYLGDPILFANSAMVKFESKDNFSVTGPYVNAVENRTGPASELSVSFVPMVRGTYSTYCQLYVVNGADYKLIRSGAVKPDMATGHAGNAAFGASMKIDVVVAGDKAVTMSAPHSTVAEAAQRAGLDSHPWSDNGNIATIYGPGSKGAEKPSGKVLWDSTLHTSYSDTAGCTSGSGSLTPLGASAAIALNGYCKFLVGTDEAFTQYESSANAGSATAVSAASPLKLRTGMATRLRISNNSSSADMTLDVEKLTRSFAIRKFQNIDGEYKVDFAKTITIKPSKWVEIWAVPMVAGDYVITTQAGTAVNVQVADSI